MAASQRGSQPANSSKKQQSISSFFTNVGSSQKREPRAPRDEPSNTVLEANSALQEDQQSENTEQRISLNRQSPRAASNEPPVRKKPRRASSGTLNSQEPIYDTALHSISPNGSKKVKTSPRTARYMYSNSPVQATANDSAISVDDESARQKARLHERFVQKLLRPDSMAEIKRRSRVLVEESVEARDEDNEDAEDITLPTKTSRKAAGGRSSAPKLTPMEKQVIDIKSKHPDTLLVVEVGYKFRFFGEDARIAAKELSIVCIPGKYRFDNHISEAHLERFASASIPVHRLHVHVKRLVAAGHKVGVVRQLETAALKAVGDNRNAPFTRKLTNLYTKGTYIDDVEGLEGIGEGQDKSNSASNFLFCITESIATGWGTDERVRVGIVAVQPATGDIVYDEFEDGFMRSEIETRILHIAPCEFVIVGELSKATEKLIQHLSGSKANVFGDKVRVEKVEKPKTMAAQALSHISNFYADKMCKSKNQTDPTASAVLDKVLQLPEHITICLSALITHMSDYGLEHVFDLTRYFQSFSARSHMLLNGTTLTSLEIYQNQTDGSRKGSLFWALDRTQTRFGQRLLRKWVGRPLLDRSKLEERISAIEELKQDDRRVSVDELKGLLSMIRVDLEKSLIRIYYGKCTRSELLSFLQTMQKIATHFSTLGSAPTGVVYHSTTLNEAIASLPTVLDDVVKFLEKINPQAAQGNDKYCFFREEEESEAILEHKLGIASVEHDLNAHRIDAAAKIKKNKVDFVAVAGIEYLIEVENSQLKNVPASWAKISGTKKVSRFHTPEVVRLIKERDQQKESLAAACDAAFQDLLMEISSQYQAFRDCIQALASLDCLCSLAEIASQPGYVKPVFTEETCIVVRKGRHPMVEQLLFDSYVPNDTNLVSEGTRALLVTGPNMGGKSSYVRQVALIAIMGQIGSYVPAEFAKLGLLDAVFTRMGAFDNMMAGESTFMVELSETSDILKHATPRSLIILDELGRGTSTHDGVAIARAVLEYVVRQTRSLTLFITHYQNLSRVAQAFGDEELKNVHMKFTESKSGGLDIVFLYEIGEGVAHRSYG